MDMDGSTVFQIKFIFINEIIVEQMRGQSKFKKH